MPEYKKRFTYIMSGLSLLPWPVWMMMLFAKRAGYDGVQILSTGLNKRSFGKYVRWGKRKGLKVEAHQFWSASEANCPALKWQVMEKLRYAPQTHADINQCMQREYIPQILYADKYDYARQDPNVYWIQTCPVRDVNGFNRTDFEDFLNEWNKDPFPICFDFQHYLEWRNGTSMNPNNFLGFSEERLAKDLLEGFATFRSMIRQIHFTDSQPEWGLKGLNVMTGTGVFPLQTVVDGIVQSGWSGEIVPEVTPGPGDMLMPFRFAKEMLCKTRNYFIAAMTREALRNF